MQSDDEVEHISLAPEVRSSGWLTDTAMDSASGSAHPQSPHHPVHVWRKDLREELQLFARDSMSSALTSFGEALRRDLRADFELLKNRDDSQSSQTAVPSNVTPLGVEAVEDRAKTRIAVASTRNSSPNGAHVRTPQSHHSNGHGNVMLTTSKDPAANARAVDKLSRNRINFGVHHDTLSETSIDSGAHDGDRSGKVEAWSQHGHKPAGDGKRVQPFGPADTPPPMQLAPPLHGRVSIGELDEPDSMVSLRYKRKSVVAADPKPVEKRKTKAKPKISEVEKVKSEFEAVTPTGDEVTTSQTMNSGARDLMDRVGSSITRVDTTDSPSQVQALNKEGKWRPRALRITNSPAFDSVVSGVILVNAIGIGFQADYIARRGPGGDSAAAFAIVERIFCVIFTAELSIRIFAYRASFLCNSEWKWNLFDSLLVGMQLFEEFTSLWQTCSSTGEIQCLWMISEDESVVAAGGTLFRIVRLLRMLRVTRLLRVLRMIGELRTMVYCLIKSMRSLLWTALLLFLLIYMIGVFLTRLVSDHLALDSGGKYDDDLRDLYGSLGDSLLCLFQAITGGADWRDMAMPLREGIHWFLGVVYTSYIAFAVLAMMNVITGVFVESVILSTKEAKDIQLLNNMRQLFMECDGSQGEANGLMEWDEFKRQCDSQEMCELFKEINVGIADARGLFKLLDADGSGQIHAEDFLSGCFRLRGPAKALDLEILIREFVHYEEMFEAKFARMEASLKHVLESLEDAR